MLSRLVWTNTAWAEYIYWHGQDKKTLKRINSLVKDALRNPEHGIGKPEPLRESLSGCWSKRIDDVNRLVYVIERDQLVIIACRYHY